MKKIFLIPLGLTFLFNFSGCNSEHKYYYIQDNEEAVIIEAESDSLAYMEAFKKFRVAVESHEVLNSAIDNNVLSEPPINFSLLNSDKVDITYSTFFSTKASFEQQTTKDVKETLGHH